MAQEQVKDADSTAEFKPLVQLQEVEVDTGEKEETEIYKQRCRLFRFASTKQPAEWVTRGIGRVRFLKHNKTGLVRVLLREEKTLKVRMNHLIQPDAILTPKQGNEEVCFQWYAKDFAEDDPWEGLFAIKFANTEQAQEFKKAYDEAREQNKKSIGTPSGNERANNGSESRSTSVVKKEVIKAGLLGAGNKPKKGQRVTVHCTGFLASTNRAFWSTEGAKPYEFVVGIGQVVPGWDEGCLDMAKGERAKLFIPSDKAYGPAGYQSFGIPPNADLIFEIEMLDFHDDSVKGSEALHEQPKLAAKTKPDVSEREMGKASTGESQWRKLNRGFVSHIEKDSKSPTTLTSDWSIAMSEYLIFAHKLRSDKSSPPTKEKSNTKPIFKSLNVAFHKWMTQQKESELDKDWSPPIRDYLDHAKKLGSSK